MRASYQHIDNIRIGNKPKAAKPKPAKVKARPVPSLQDILKAEHKAKESIRRPRRPVLHLSSPS